MSGDGGFVSTEFNLIGVARLLVIPPESLDLCSTFHLIGDGSNQRLSRSLIQVSACFSMLEALMLGGSYLKVVTQLSEYGGKFKKLKRLVICFGAFGDESLTNLISVVNSCPILVEFVLMLLWLNPERTRTPIYKVEKSRKRVIKSKSLKVFEFGGYYGRFSDVELINLVKNVVGLETIIIDPLDGTYIQNHILRPTRAEKEEQEEARRVVSGQYESLRESIPPHVQLLLRDYSNGAVFTLAAASSPVKFLPGFDGPLPFELETGYIGVGESEDVQLFCYFIKSERNPAKDPLMIWLTGGPGCSSLKGLVYDIGPVRYVLEHYSESLPKLVLNPYSWTKFASIIFIDQPVGTGFSYARNTKAAAHTDVMRSCEYVYEFLRKWLVDHPQFILNQVYIGGDSYSGQMVPIITQLISDGNDIGLEPKIDLKGYVLGNPVTTPSNDSRPQFAHGMGLIPDELFESLKKTCQGIYHDIDPENNLCIRDMHAFYENIANIERHHILEPICLVSVPKPSKRLGDTRIMYEKYGSDLINHDKLHEDTPTECRAYWYVLVDHWANYEIVQEAIHVRNGTIGDWSGCNIMHDITIIDVVPYHANLSIRGYRSLIYSGDHDMIVPSIATEKWIKSLNYSIVDDWHPWIVHGQVGGYTRTYANRMTFATVKGGGHVAPEYKPRECMSMFKRWISYEPF